MMELINQAKRENIEIEIYKERTVEDYIHVFNQKLKKYEQANIVKYTLKCLYQGKTITLELEDISNPTDIIALIKENSQVVENDDENRLSELKNFVGKQRNNKPFDPKRVMDDLLSFDEAQNELVKSIETEVVHQKKEITIQNQYGSMVDFDEYIMLHAEVIATKDGKNYEDDTLKYVKEYNKEEMDELVDEAINKTISQIGATSIKTGNYNILFDHNVVAQLLMKFTECFKAEKIADKTSLLEDKDYKNKIFSELITIVEDPLNENFASTRSFDLEGTLKKHQVLVNKGVFEKKMHTVKTALKEKTESTGNCGVIRNCYIMPGDSTVDELKRQLNNGVIITKLEGMHAGINIKTGHISLQAQGYKVEDGKIVNPLNMMVVTMNFKTFLNSVKAVGNDLTSYNLFFGAPSILCENIAISGNE